MEVTKPTLFKQRPKGKRRPFPGQVSIIVPAHNAASRLRQTLQRLTSWRAVREIIVVANGCTDNTVAIAKRARCTVIEYVNSIGHDTGRVIGASHATGDILLFLDADIVWQVGELRPFVQGIHNGADIVLNAYPFATSRFYHHPTAVAKRALNIALNHCHLKASSLTAVPHAIRRSALETIGIDALAVPPVAMARAVEGGLKVERGPYINVRTRNRWRKPSAFSYSVRDMIIGDHMEAFQYLLQQRGSRGGLPDGGRRYDLLTHPQTDTVLTSDDPVAVIPARDEASTLPDVLEQIRLADIGETYVVDNGSTDDTGRVAQFANAHVQCFPQHLGHDVGRAIGIRAVQGAPCILVLDSDFVVPAEDLRPFMSSVLEHGVDVALNDLTPTSNEHLVKDPVSTFKRFLNIALGRPDLGFCSLTAIPHALSRRSLQTIPYADFATPPKAMVRAVLSQLNVLPVHFVDVVKPNRYRPELHAQKYGAPVTWMIVGDHLEALELLIAQRGARAGFVQPRDLQSIRFKREG